MASANEIPAGGEGKITVTIQAGSYRRQVRQIVNVQSNDPDHPKTELTVTANVLVDLEAIPNLLKFEKDQATAQTIVKNYSDTPVEVHKMTSSNEYVKVSISAMTIPAKGEVVVTTELLPGAPKEFFSGWVEIQSNLKTMPTLQIRVWRDVAQ